jgi:NodT family efflux transporter outer membrane factor (OMF) lipoprotein
MNGARPFHRVWPRLAAVGCLVGLVLGCGAPAREVRPPVAFPDAFSASGDAALPARWWRLFGEPVLDALVEAALAGNLDLAVARDRILQAEAVARRVGADRVPHVDASGSLGARASSGTSGVDFGIGVAASWELDLWGRVEALREAARYDVEAVRDSREAAAMSLAAEVASAWLQLAEVRGQIELLAAQGEVNAQVLELVRLRFRAGRAGGESVLRQRQRVEASAAERARLESSAGVLEHRLAILLGRMPGTVSVEAGPELPDPPPLPATGIPAERVCRRPDVRAAYHAVLAADRRTAAALADRFPRISLAAGASVSEPSGGMSVGNWLVSLGANLLAPIFDGGRIEAEIDRTRAAADEALHVYARVLLRAVGEVEDALWRIARGTEILESLDRQIEVSQAAMERSRRAYLLGEADYLAVLDALETVQALERTRLSARREQLTYYIELCRALAGGWEAGQVGEAESGDGGAGGAAGASGAAEGGEAGDAGEAE